MCACRDFAYTNQAEIAHEKHGSNDGTQKKICREVSSHATHDFHPHGVWRMQTLSIYCILFKQLGCSARDRLPNASYFSSDWQTKWRLHRLWLKPKPAFCAHQIGCCTVCTRCVSLRQNKISLTSQQLYFTDVPTAVRAAIHSIYHRAHSSTVYLNVAWFCCYKMLHRAASILQTFECTLQFILLRLLLPLCRRSCDRTSSTEKKFSSGVVRHDLFIQTRANRFNLNSSSSPSA